MPSKEDYLNGINNQPQNEANSIGGQQPGQSQEQTALDSKYSALETVSYKDMLNSKIQAGLARDQAQKYMQTNANAAGFGTQGVSESSKVGIYNTYQNAINNANNQYAQSNLELQTARADEEQALAESNWQNAMNLLQTAEDQADLDYVRENFYDSMDENQKKYFDYYYNSYSKSLAEENANTTETAKNYEYTDSNGMNYTTNFSRGVGKDKDFWINYNGTSYRVEMNMKATGINPGDYADKQVGEIFVIGDKLYVKDEKGDIRHVGASGAHQKDFTNLVEAMGYTRNGRKLQ